MTALTSPPPTTRTGPSPTTGRGTAAVDAATRLATGAALWMALLLVTYWWSTGGGLQDLTGRSSGLTSAGRLTGLLGSLLLLVQVLLAARVPVLERAFGQDRLLRHHRVVGLTSFTLMIAHVVLTTWGYSGALSGTPGTLWDLVWTYPGMLLAAAGTACLVMVVVTSIRVARRRLRYESWHLLHLYAYLGAGLALPHQLWTGHDFLASPARTVFWWTLWAGSVGAVLLWRVGVPLARSLRHDLRVAGVVSEAPGVVSVWLAGRRLDRLPVAAGQFATWRFLGRRGWTRGNPYSLSAAPEGRHLRITVKAAGESSAALAALRPGTRAVVEGPYGRLTERARTRRKVALIGAGVGVAPLRALAEGLAYAPGEAVLLQRFTDAPLFVDELNHLRRTRGLEVLWLPGRRRSEDSWLGATGTGSTARVSDLAALTWWVPDIAERDVYVCGPDPWAEAVLETLSAAGVPVDQTHVESFRW